VLSVQELAAAARGAAYQLAQAPRPVKDAALHAMAAGLRRDSTAIVQANGKDVELARAADASPAMVDRLALTSDRIEAMAQGLEHLATLADPIGAVVRGSTLPNGVRLRQLRVPLGVVAMIYEGRPNVTADAAGICLKSGNASLLRGSSSALNSNRAIVSTLRRALDDCGLNPDAIALVEGGREVVKELMTARGLIDLLIPRGGAGLIQTVVTESSVPVIETGVGNVHVYVDASADLSKAVPIIVNAKMQRPSVCNAAETLLVHADVAATFLPQVARALDGVRLHADVRSLALLAGSAADVTAATDADFDTEYLDLDLAVAVVDSFDEAVQHIRRHSSGHTEVIVTDSASAAAAFVAQVDAAAVIVNASSRFVDGGEFGFGAEIGISTQKTHARGPMGLTEMTSTKWVLEGDGQTRA
jgi:glutamate-5-semialdehyde dehydrogenase